MTTVQQQPSDSAFNQAGKAIYNGVASVGSGVYSVGRFALLTSAGFAGGSLLSYGVASLFKLQCIENTTIFSQPICDYNFEVGYRHLLLPTIALTTLAVFNMASGSDKKSVGPNAIKA